MTLEEYIVQLKETQKKLEAKQEYEVCAEISWLIDVIERKDVEAFIAFKFDVKKMTKVGFFPKKVTSEQAAKIVCHHFGYASIFEYAIREKGLCPYWRYEKGLYDMILKVNF